MSCRFGQGFASGKEVPSVERTPEFVQQFTSGFLPLNNINSETPAVPRTEHFATYITRHHSLRQPAINIGNVIFLREKAQSLGN